MPSVVVGWEGQCREPATRRILLGKLSQVAELSHARIDPPAPITRYNNDTITGRILLWRGLLEAGDHEGSPRFIEATDLELDGLEFRLSDPRNLYRDDDRISFVFASLRGRPDWDGTIVQVDDRGLCQQYDDPELKAAEYFVKPASIHLRYYFEQWIDQLLGYVKHFHVPDLRYWRYEDLSGYYRFSNLDPCDLTERDRCWEGIVATFNSEIDSWFDEAVDLRSRLDHANQTGRFAWDWVSQPYAPLDTELVVDQDLQLLISDAGARDELMRAARIAIKKFGQGYSTDSLVFQFRDTSVSMSSQLFGERRLVIKAGLARRRPDP